MVGPDLLGIVGATAFLMAVIGVFALIDRLLCGAWEALNGSPGWGLVAGLGAWGRGTEAVAGAPHSPSGGSPSSPDPVPMERVRGPGLLPWAHGAGRHEFALVRA